MAADHVAASAANSLHGIWITCVHTSAPWRLISLSIITPNLPPGSMIRKLSGLDGGTSGGFAGSPHHKSSNHAERCPIPPPIRTAFLAGILLEISLILARIDRGRGRRLM